MSPDLEKLPLVPAGRRFNPRKIVMIILSLFVVHRVGMLLYDHNKAQHRKPHVQLKPDRGYGELYKQSWQSLTHALNYAKPQIATVGEYKATPAIAVETIDAPTSVDAIQLSQSDLSSLKTSHSHFVRAIRETSQLSVIYQRGQQGIVVTATLNELPQLLVQIRLLRRTRSNLPIEVFLLTQDDFDAKICREILPRLDAHCTILEEHMDSSPLPLMPKSKQPREIHAQEPLNKLLAIFFSRFEDILLLDPTTLVYNNPDMMLKEEPFLSTGMLLWPDFWASTVSPKLFQIQDTRMQKPNHRDNIRTVDLGQMIVSKSQQSATLLLAIYYTYYGRNLYDALLQQSSGGESGAQAIKSAARYLESPYYMMKRSVEAVGFPDLDSDNEGFRGVAMLQAFASDDFHRVPKDRQRPVFIRQNNPSLHPAFLMDREASIFRKKQAPKKSNGFAAYQKDPATMEKVKGLPPSSLGRTNPFAIPVRPPTPQDQGLHHRMWEWFGGRYASNGWRDPDPERALWEEVATVACVDWPKFRVWPLESKAAQTVCQRINYHRAELGWKEFFVL